jgi:hypothetical protein
MGKQFQRRVTTSHDPGIQYFLFKLNGSFEAAEKTQPEFPWEWKFRL